MVTASKTNGPLVSVLMTAYNREKYIGEAIESVLASSWPHFELIIVDDGSKDATVAIARKYEAQDPRVRVYINEVNLGDYPNRNRAASYAKGEYIKYLDSDDLIYTYGLEAFVTMMEHDKEAAAGFCYKKNVSHQPFPIIMEPAESLRYHFFKEGFLDCGPTGTIIRRECFEALGGFSGKRMVGDLEFGLKAAGQYKVMLLPPALAFWRSHGEQEIFFGIDNDMYYPMTRTVLKERFETLPQTVLTTEEKDRIFTNMTRTHRVVKGKKIIKQLLFKKSTGKK